MKSKLDRQREKKIDKKNRVDEKLIFLFFLMELAKCTHTPIAVLVFSL